MRTIIAGSRDANKIYELLAALASFGCVCDKDITVILSGCARGADRMGELYAARHEITLEKYPADWNAYGKKAGYLRNEQMAKKADALVALWDGKSRGTKHMIDLARKYGLFVHIHYVNKE